MKGVSIDPFYSTKYHRLKSIFEFLATPLSLVTLVTFG